MNLRSSELRVGDAPASLLSRLQTTVAQGMARHGQAIAFGSGCETLERQSVPGGCSSALVRVGAKRETRSEERARRETLFAASSLPEEEGKEKEKRDEGDKYVR